MMPGVCFNLIQKLRVFMKPTDKRNDSSWWPCYVPIYAHKIGTFLIIRNAIKLFM